MARALSLTNMEMSSVPAPECPRHGPDCDFNLTDHPLPPQGWPTSKGPYPDFDFDDVHGEMADIEARKIYG